MILPHDDEIEADTASNMIREDPSTQGMDRVIREIASLQHENNRMQTYKALLDVKE